MKAQSPSVATPVPGQPVNPTGVRQYDVEAVNRGKKPKLYKGREPIYPRRVEGRFRTLKWWIMAVTLTIYYVTPWIRWDRGPYAPDQAVLVDLANRRFFFFVIEIWPQEFFYVAGLLIMAGIGLFLVTSAVGRAWCGYACPQTVWTDLFIWVERLVIGDRNARIKLDNSPWTARKARLKASVHGIWILIAIATGGAWIFYFADAPTLAAQFLRGEAAPTAYITVAVLTFTTYSLGGLMREQVCTYMCPWPRIQAAMMDEHSLTVTYNDWRGEPRSRHQKRLQREGTATGDCIDCNACVAVCPAGIDIRDGQQLQCITCALCIDACDDVMTKIGKPRGLISYTTLSDYAANTARAATEGLAVARAKQVLPGWREVMRPRVFLYFGLWSLIGIGMLVAVIARDRLDLSVAHDRNPRYVQLSDGSIRNGYTVKIMNMEPTPRTFDFGLVGLPGGLMWSPEIVDEPARRFAVEVPPDQVREFRVFVKAHPDDLEAIPDPFAFRTFEMGGGRDSSQTDAVFEAPQ
ncbi:cytochrome c oxidase accessory protein CcoG [Acuticoccus sp. M5D2P5]|uniref:cytochrome c oxidase accessory protein CcoG n=1 Tax=Acuticoccus kalidii TaxID=2910977 RepID=UPI001F428E66|nr:cytochrome c oxidase accessory protein CcoG [Acuticoccus kalidii]MCF3934430.1 cytochrome c oxidase accessory protein CcoG [Acuticoccus kalidii]